MTATLKTLISDSFDILRLGLPLMVAQMAQLSMSIVDTMMVGRLGTHALAGLAIAHTVFVICFLFGLGILSAIRPFIAEAFGAGRNLRIGAYFRQGLLLSLPLSLLAMIICHMSPLLFQWTQQESALVPYAHSYLKTLSWGMPGIFAYICLRQLTEGTSQTAPTMWLSCIGALINIPLNYIFIFGHYGFPKLGIVGAALTTVIIHWAMLAAFLIYVWKSKKFHAYRLFQIPSWGNTMLIPKILRLGIPLAGVRLGEVGFFLSITLLMGWLGSAALASHQIGINAASFTFMMPLGLSLAMTVKVAQAIGKRDQHAVQRAGWLGFFWGGGIMLPSAIIFWFFPQAVARLYTDDPQLILMAKSLLRVAAIFQIFDGLQIVGVGILQGLRQTRIPFLAIVFSFWVIGLPLSFILAFRCHRGPQGLWEGMIIALGLAAALHIWRFRSLIARQRRVLK